MLNRKEKGRKILQKIDNKITARNMSLFRRDAIQSAVCATAILSVHLSVTVVHCSISQHSLNSLATS